MREIGKIFSFHAAHHLPHHMGLCRKMHGHTYKLEVRIRGEVFDCGDPDDGMIMDFGELKDRLKGVIEQHDHELLNNIYPNPTAEIMVSHIAEIIKENLPVYIDLTMVKLWETETSYAIWRPEST